MIKDFFRTFILLGTLLLICFTGIYFDSYAQDVATVNLQDKKRVEGQLNSTEFTEYAPSISADGRTMIIESDRDVGWRLYESSLQADGTWSNLKPLEKVNNYGDPQDLIGGPSIGYDGNTLYFFASFSGGFGSEDIYYSVREGDDWGEPVNIGPPINTPEYEGFPSISSDGKTLYFTRILQLGPDDDERNETCYEIFYSRKDKQGNWQIPQPLPYPANYECEKSPRIMADNRTLIFSSYRPGGMGSFDLYQSQVDEDGEWTMPVPLTFVNTVESDQFACISASGELMYFNILGDIYSVVIPENLRQFKNIIMQGYVRDEDTKQGIVTSIRVTDATTSEEIFTINNAADGRYSVVMAAGKVYNIEFFKEGYSTAMYSYDLTSMDTYDEIQQDVSLFSTIRLRVNVYDEELFEAIPGLVAVNKQGKGSSMLQATNNVEQGYVILEIPIGSVYTISVSLENFSSDSFGFDVSDFVLYRDFEKDIQLVPQKVNVPINVTDITNNGKVRGRIIIRNKSRDEVIEVNSNEMIALRIGDRYEIEATSDKGYFFASTSIEVSKDGIKTEDLEDEVVNISGAELEMKLTPITENQSLNLNDILFESNSAQLSEVSFLELERVIDVMVKNPTMKVEVSAHTDDVGSEIYNGALSQRRADAVVDYLSANNVPFNRFEAKGYGESRPLVPNDTNDNRAKNRRVELKVLEVLN
ncbi:OmpA family protein [Bacteroidota bacterium]